MNSAGFTLNNKVYDFLKWVALILFPGLGALYFGLGQIWHFPAVEEVVGSITVVDTFLGLILNKSSKNFDDSAKMPSVKGDIVVTQDSDGTVSGMRLEAAEDPFILEDGSMIVFKVKRDHS